MTNNFISKERNKLKYFVGNWKMFGDLDSFKIIERIRQFYIKFRTSNKKNKIILCVPNTLIGFYKKKLNFYYFGKKLRFFKNLNIFKKDF